MEGQNIPFLVHSVFSLFFYIFLFSLKFITYLIPFNIFLVTFTDKTDYVSFIEHICTWCHVEKKSFLQLI